MKLGNSLPSSSREHGATILAERGEFNLKHNLKSDLALLNKLTAKILEECKEVRLLSDPTRGGLATTLNEIAKQRKIGIKIKESTIPIKEEVQGLCDILGFDPLYLACEGRMIIIVAKEEAEIIGEVIKDQEQDVYLKTRLGGTRILRMLSEQLLPRIC